MNHITDQIEIYLTDGLVPDERSTFEMHVAECAACAAALDEARVADAAMSELFSSARPSMTFEQRVIDSLRQRQTWRGRRIVHPMVRRVAVGLAASVMLAAVGYVGDRTMNGRRFAGMPPLGKSLTRWANVQADMVADKDDQTSSQPPTSLSLSTAADTQNRTRGDLFDRAERNKTRGVQITVPDFTDAPDLSLNSASSNKNQAPQGGGGIGGKGGGGGGIDENQYAYFASSPQLMAWNTSGLTLGDSSAIDSHRYFKAGAIDKESTVADGRDAGKYSKANDAAGEREEIRKEVRAKGDETTRLNSDLFQVQATTANKEAAIQIAQVDIKTRTEGTADGDPKAPARTSEPKPDAPVVPAPKVDATKQPATEAEPPRAAAIIKPKIIRSGEMEFEVDNFDSAILTITKIVTEDGGYVSTTNSDKLPNGKVKGSIILRVAPERLDTLVLKLRGIGDLRTQRIAAQDITKQYTDISSALRAAQAMQERLLDIIKNGKGTVKDLLEAEKQLGVWREKVEQLEGEIRYYDNQVALSTLTLTLYERDIRMAAIASETETVTMALETEKVEDAYAKAKDAVAQAKGRIVNSALKQYDAGQFGATISAQVPPDSADAVIGRLRQIDGRIARFDRARNQTTSNGNQPVDPRSNDAVKVKREDVIINLTLYNLANIAPRRWTNLTLVAANVDQTYRALIEQVRAAGGRIVESQINHPRPDQTTGSVKLDVPSEKADTLLLALRGMGETLQVNTTENASTQDVTESKRGFVISIGSLSAFKPRETQQVQLATTNVPAAFNDLLNTIRAGSGRVLTSHLDEQDSRNAVGTLEFELGRESAASFEQAMNKNGQIVSRLADRSTDTDNTVDSKIHVRLAVGSSEQLPPRQRTELSVEVTDVQKAMDDLQAAVLSAGGRQIDNPIVSQGDGSQMTAKVSVDLPLESIQSLITTADGMGNRKSRQTSIDARAPEGKLARARLTVTFATPASLAGSDDTIWAGIRRGLGTSVRWLSTSFTMIVVGLCVVLPWLVLVWGGWRGVKWMKKPVGIPKSE